MELLVLPMLLDWQERQGGDMGITVPASVNMVIFLLDTRDAAAVLCPAEEKSPWYSVLIMRKHRKP